MSFSGHCHNGDHLPQIKNNRIFFMQKLLQNTIDLSFANFAFSRNRNLGKGGLHSICYHRETITEIFGETKLQLSCTTGNRTDYSSINDRTPIDSKVQKEVRTLDFRVWSMQASKIAFPLKIHFTCERA